VHRAVKINVTNGKNIRRVVAPTMMIFLFYVASQSVLTSMMIDMRRSGGATPWRATSNDLAEELPLWMHGALASTLTG